MSFAKGAGISRILVGRYGVKICISLAILGHSAAE